MSKLQPLRGNPEAKISSIFTDFSGGINVVESDDDVKTNQLRFASNVDIDKEGNLKNRKGWIKHEAFSEVTKDLTPLYKGSGFTYSKTLNVFRSMSFFVPTLIRDVNPGDSITASIGKNVFGFAEPMRITLSGDYEGQKQSFHIDFDNDEGPITVKEAIVPTDIKGPFNVSEVSVNYYSYQPDDFGPLFICKTEDYERLVTEQLSTEHLGLFVIKDQYGQMDGLLSSETLDDFQNLYSVNTVKPVYGMGGDGEESEEGFSASAPLVLALFYRRYNNVVCYDTIHIYNLYGTYRSFTNKYVYGDESSNFPKNSSETHNYREGLVSSITNVSFGLFKNSLFLTLPGLQNLIEIKDGSKKGDENKDKIEVIPIGGDSSTNQAYKPTPMEVRRIGFNMLGSTPLTWIDNPSTSLSAINGVFITNNDGEPIQYIPSDNSFIVYAMVSGSPNNVSMKIWDYVDGERKEVPISFTKSNDFPLVKFTGRLLANPTTEVEIEITIADVPPIVFRDYYPIGNVANTTPISLNNFNPGDYSTTTIEGRLVLYGGNIIWWSDFKEPTYIPNYNYIRLPFSPDQDEIVNITFFRSSYIIFTRKSIYKLRGAFNPSDMEISLVTDYVGCLAPKSIRMINNQLIFLSNRGLYSLKSETFREDMENVQPLDTRIAPLFEQNVLNASVAFVTDEEYILFTNQNNSHAQGNGYKGFRVGTRVYKVPDVIRYYYDRDAIVFDYLNIGDSIDFIYSINHNLISTKMGPRERYRPSDPTNVQTKHYVRKEGSTDFGEPFQVEFETAGVSMGYPAHEKKVKKLWLKMSKEAFEQTVSIEIYSDGILIHELTEFPKSQVAGGDSTDSASDQRLIRLPGLKGRNITFKFRVKSGKTISFDALSLEWKLGKMRG